MLACSSSSLKRYNVYIEPSFSLQYLVTLETWWDPHYSLNEGYMGWTTFGYIAGVCNDWTKKVKTFAYMYFFLSSSKLFLFLLFFSSVLPSIRLNDFCLSIRMPVRDWWEAVFTLHCCFLHLFLRSPICPIRYLTAAGLDNPACLELSLHVIGAMHYLIKTGIHT